MSARVLLVAEGPSELGHESLWSKPRRKRAVREGYFQPMIRRLIDSDALIDAQRIVNLPPTPKRLAGHADRAAAALVLASTQGYDVLVYVKDVDRSGGTKAGAVERRKKLALVAREIRKGLQSVPDATTRAIQATPCRMLECWALADANALAELASKEGDPTSVPKTPEDSWGHDADPTSNHPKCALKRVLGRDAGSDDFATLAESSDLEVVRERCPDSFVPFHDEARSR